MKRSGLTLLLIAGLVLVLSPSARAATSTNYAAQSINDLRAERDRLNKIAQQKAADAKAQADTAAAAKAKINELDGQITETQTQLNQTSSTITSTQSQIDQKTTDIAARQADIALREARIQSTLRQFFKVQLTHENIGMIGVAFSDDGLSQQAQQYQSYDAIKKELNRQRDGLNSEKQKLEQDKGDLEGKRSSLQALANQQAVQKQQLAKQQDQQAALKANAEVAYAQLKKEESAVMAQEAKLEQAILAKVQAQIRSSGQGVASAFGTNGMRVSQGQTIGYICNLSAGDPGRCGFSTGAHLHFSVFTPEGAYVNPTTRLGGTYIYPVSNYRISQGFGPANWRNSVYTYHYGIDFATAAYSPVRAAADGMAYNKLDPDGYGHYVIIKHDDGWVTLYGHLEPAI